MKFLKVITFSILVSLLISPSNIWASNTEKDSVVIFINQVRGSECCDPGSIEHFNRQIDAFKKDNLEATFSIRYDALTDNEYIEIIKDLDRNKFEIGGFLEITPQLAADSGVEYLGNKDQWYQAQHAYTVGYEDDDRKKLIDQYMKVFDQALGYYPKTTTAWIMDTDSLNYLRDEYGVANHQITREQWGTDSYTMSGGPVHYPYFASENWAFIPDRNKNDTDNNLLIFRQTASDPLQNYGDTSNAFTSQPNDYAIDGKKTDYFINLMKELLNQEQNSYSFALLGLENSMDIKFQNEFEKQISIVSNLDDTKILNAKNFSESYANKISKEKLTTLIGKNLVSSDDNKVVWINAEDYRIRLLITSDKVIITDLRLFNQDLVDPYNTTKAEKLAYWVVPFIFDGSRFYSNTQTTNESSKRKFINKLKDKFLPEFKSINYELQESRKDINTNPDGLIVSDKNNTEYSIKNDGTNVSVVFKTSKGEPIEIIFNPKGFTLPKDIDTKLNLNSSNFLKANDKSAIFEKNDKEYFSLNKDCAKELCNYSLNNLTDDNFKQLRKIFYPLFFPEIVARPVSNESSVFYAHNKYTVAKKNPVRLIFIPKDNQGFSTSVSIQPSVSVKPSTQNIVIHDQESNGTTFIDVTQGDYGEHIVSFKLGDIINLSETIFFAPDCKIEKLHCLLHPKQTSWYIKSMLYTKLRDF